MALLKYKIEILVHILECFSMTQLNVSPHEIVFHTRPRIPLTFDLNLTRDTSKTFISRYFSQLQEHSHYDKSDFNPFLVGAF